MKTRLLHWWEHVNSSYWFVPSVMIAGATMMAAATLYVDRQMLISPEGLGWLYTGGVEGARSLLATVASSVITVAGVVFSITIATLTQASTQFGPRLLRNFMRDTGNQIVLGTFVATFAYCLLVLRTTYGEDDGAGAVPNLSVTTAVVLAGASIGVLIYFIHHVSRSIQAPVLVASVGRDLESAITRLFPEKMGDGAAERPPDPLVPDDIERDARAVCARHSGYLQAMDAEGLLAAAREADVIVKLAVRPGDFLVEMLPMLYVYPASRAGDELEERLRGMMIIGGSRTPEQDAEFVVDQLVEIAVRALSPGINDPFTAVTCVDWLGAALCILAGRRFPSCYRLDDDGRLRVIARVLDFDGICDAAFNQIRQYGVGSVAVTLRLLETIERVATVARTDQQRAALLRHAQMIAQPDDRPFDDNGDRTDLRARVAAAIEAIRSRNDAPRQR